MKLIYSFWSDPIKNNPDKLQKVRNLYHLSVLYANSIGFKTILYTDKLGVGLLGNFPYKRIEPLDIKNIDKHFWASSKIVAMSKENAPFIHIDGDVFLKQKHLYNLITKTDYDIIVQSVEGGEAWHRAYAPYINEVKSNCGENTFDYDINLAYNCGIIGFKNDAVKKKFIKSFYKMVNCLSNSNKKVEMMVLVEQWNLLQLAKKENAKVYPILGNSIDWNVWNQKAIDLGYTHLLGAVKWSECSQNKILSLINNYGKKN